MAIAGKSGRSAAGEATLPEVHMPPPFSDHRTRTCSFAPGFVSDGVGPFDQASTISFVAPAPLGAPLAMSTVGNEPSRAPATPSFVRSPDSGSRSPVMVKCVTTCAGRSNVLPPLNERTMKIASVLVFGSPPSQNTYNVPLLSVLTAQSWRPPSVPLFTDGDSCLLRQVSPPSDELLTTIGSGKPPFSWLRKAASQT